MMRFRDEYYFLSNMYPSPVELQFQSGTVKFTCAEAAFQACKVPGHEGGFAGLNGYDAKRDGKRVLLRSDWEQVKLAAMRIVVNAKFTQNPHLMAKLCSTGSLPLVEENSWGDRFWGVCKGVGQNHLGKILMDVRDSSLKDAQLLEDYRRVFQR